MKLEEKFKITGVKNSNIENMLLLNSTFTEPITDREIKNIKEEFGTDTK
jgi:hypothetical protein